METAKKLAIGLAAVGAATMLPGVAVAQDQGRPAIESAIVDSILSGTTIILRVDGMSCPFCAYGLEKHLKEIAAVDSVIVRVSDGLVQIREKGDQRISHETLEETVTKAGFTLREMERIGSP